MFDTLLRQARANMNLFERRQTHASGGQFFRTHGVDWTCAPHTGILLFPHCRQADTDEVIETAVSHCHGQGVGVRAWCDFPNPRHVRQRLAAWGFRDEFVGLFMASNLETLPERTPPPGLEFALMTDLARFETHPHPWFGDQNNPGNRRALEATHALSTTVKKVWNLLAIQEGRAVGHVTISASIPADSFPDAGLYSVGVLPEKRGQGIGMALVQAACRLAREEGYRVAVLQCGPHLRRFYGKNGFQEVGVVESWCTGEWEGARHIAPERVFARPKSQSAASVMATRDFITAVSSGKTALALQALRRYPALVKDTISGWDASALHFAAFHGENEVVRWLLTNGADPTLRDSRFNSTPEGWANHNKQPETADLLKLATDERG